MIVRFKPRMKLGFLMPHVTSSEDEGEQMKLNEQ